MEAMFTTKSDQQKSVRPPTGDWFAKSEHQRRERGASAGIPLMLGGEPQAKLVIGAANDPLEMEADRIAAHVTGSTLPEPTSASARYHLSPNTAPGGEVQTAMMTPAGTPASSARPAPTIVQEVIGSSGQPLDIATRSLLEPRLDRDLSHVRVHSDSKAAASARMVNARAYTVGSDIVFGDGQFAPTILSGQQLLAHELVHVVQQNAGGLSLQRQPIEFPPDVISVQAIETMPVEKVSGTTGYEGHVIETAHNISNRARINAVELATQVESACEAFKLYAQPKLDQLAGEVTVTDLVSGLATALATAVGGTLAAKIAQQFGRQLVTQISRQLVKAVNDRAKSASPDSKDTKDLSAAVDSIAMAARDSGTGIIDTVSSAIDPFTNDIINTINAGKQLSAEQENFVGPFYLASNDVVDTLLEGYGIPSGASATALQLDVYQALVEKFQEKLIWIQASFREKLEMGFAYDFGAQELTLSYKAGQQAQQAGKIREGQLKPSR